MKFDFNTNKRFFVFAGVLVVAVVLVAGGYFVWDGYFSEAGKARRFAAEQIRVYEEQEQAYIEAMTADTYGGKTPQETLDLFVEALRVEDIELASKYFLLDENLSREKWVDRLEDIRSRNLLAKMIKDLQRVVVDSDGSLYEGDFGFVIYADNGLVGAHVDIEFNKYSQVWKIESL